MAVGERGAKPTCSFQTYDSFMLAGIAGIGAEPTAQVTPPGLDAHVFTSILQHSVNHRPEKGTKFCLSTGFWTKKLA
jgi:hypothetical protein